MAQLATELTATLQLDVDLARSLELVPPVSYLAPEKEPWTKPVFENWVNVGASGLRAGSARGRGRQGQGQLRFYDVVAQRELLSRSYELPGSRGRARRSSVRRSRG